MEDYEKPQATVEPLTDEQIDEIWERSVGYLSSRQEQPRARMFARALLAATPTASKADTGEALKNMCNARNEGLEAAAILLESQFFGSRTAAAASIRALKSATPSTIKADVPTMAYIAAPLPLQEGGQTANMPELPGAGLTHAGECTERGHWYSADQMRAYGLSCIAAVSPQGGEAKEVRQYRRKKTPDSWKNTTDSWYDIYDDNPDIWNADPIWYDYRTIYTAAPASLGEAKAVENMESAIQKLGQERRVAYENPELNRRECYELYGEIVGIEKCLALFPAVPIAPALPVAAETNKDAERYRWLRDDERQSVATVSIFDDGRWSSHSQDDLDAAIDAARVQGEKG